jgi:hypothetical protein
MFLCFQETNGLKKDGERQTEELEELRTANKSLQDQMSRLKQAVSPYIFSAHFFVIGNAANTPIRDVRIYFDNANFLPHITRLYNRFF